MIHPAKNFNPPVPLQDILVHLGEPRDHNPYLNPSLEGEARLLALTALCQDLPEAKAHTYWYAPAAGGARRITDKNQIDWSTPGEEWVHGKFVYVEPVPVQDYPVLKAIEQMEDQLFKVERTGPDFKDLVKGLCEIPPVPAVNFPPSHEQILLQALLSIRTRVAMGSSHQEVQDIITKALKETGHGF